MNYELRIYDREKVIEAQNCDNATALIELINLANRAFNGYRYEVRRDGKLIDDGVLDFPMEGNG